MSNMENLRVIRRKVTIKETIVLLPAQIVRTGRRVIYRIMSYNGWLKGLFAAWEHLRWLRAT
jgi:hypothetical protein